MERIYGVPFGKANPNFLVNPETGRKLELDVYNSDYKIAVEYNGEQHYVFPNHWHGKTEEGRLKFNAQLRRDDLKKRLCAKNGVYLINVPYTVPYNKIAKYIASKLPESVRNRLEEEKTLDEIDID